MKQSINFSQFCDAFRDMNRNDNYSYEGKQALFDMFEQFDEDCDTETELDVIAICCEFSEYPSALECIEETGYDFTPDEDDDDEDKEESALEYLGDNTMLWTFDGGIIIQSF